MKKLKFRRHKVLNTANRAQLLNIELRKEVFLIGKVFQVQSLYGTGDSPPPPVCGEQGKDEGLGVGPEACHPL